MSRGNFIAPLILFVSFHTLFAAIEIAPWKTLVGNNIRSSFGWAIAGVDINGDGIKDIVVGAPMYTPTPSENSIGAVFIYLGGEDIDTIPIYIIKGERPNDQFGISVSSAGDFNGDGYEDLLVGANVSRSIGRAYIFLGGPSFTTSPYITFDGEEVVDNYGYSCAGVGDVNLDGYDDVLVGALYNDARGDRTGRAYLYFGGAFPDNIPDLIFTGPESLMDFGCGISAGWDYNGDGASDMLVGAVEAGMYWMAPGEALVFFGGTLLDDIPDLRCEGENPMDFFGGTLSGIGRFNGDRYDDFAVGAYNNGVIDSSAGRVYVYFGGPTVDTIPDIIINGHLRNEGFGNMVAACGDFDGDGFDDLAVGGNINIFTGDTTGMLFIYCGGNPPDTIFDYWATGENPDDRFGWSIAPLGDVNGDGLPDLACGATNYENGKGKVYIYLGFRSLTPPEVRIIEPFEGARSACADQGVKLYLYDFQGIDTLSIRINVNGNTYHYDGHIIRLEDTLLTFTPPRNFSDGERVNFCLEDVANSRGVHIESPLCVSYLIDLSPPTITNISPPYGTTVSTHQPEFSFRLSDEISGYNFEDFKVVVNGDTISYPDTSITFVEEKGFFSLVRKGKCFYDNDTVIVEFTGLRDNPDFCEPNVSTIFRTKLSLDLTWQLMLTASSSSASSQQLVIGQVRGATDGFDPGIDRIFIPLPPSMLNIRISHFDPRFPYIQWLVQDYRSPLDDSASWHLFSSGSGEAIISWDPRLLPEGIFLLNGICDMRRDSLFNFTLSDTLTIVYRWLPMVYHRISISPGWNLVSIPVYPRDYNLETLTETRWLTYYGYDPVGRRYFRCTRAGPGVGLFVLSLIDIEVDIVGSPADTLTLRLYPGWNLIGGAGQSVNIDDIDFSPPEAVEPFSLYQYNPLTRNYEETREIRPGKGYWIFARRNCIARIPGRSGTHRKFEPLSQRRMIPPNPPNSDATKNYTPLLRVYPNPFNSCLNIDGAQEKIEIYTMDGVLVRTIYADRFSWDGRDFMGEKVPSGVYIIRSGNEHTRAILLR